MNFSPIQFHSHTDVFSLDFAKVEGYNIVGVMNSNGIILVISKMQVISINVVSINFMVMNWIKFLSIIISVLRLCKKSLKICR